MKTAFLLALSAPIFMLTNCAKDCACDFTDDGIVHITFETPPPTTTFMELYPLEYSYSMLMRFEIKKEDKSIEINLNQGNYTLRTNSPYWIERHFQIQAKNTTHVHFSSESWNKD